MTRVFQKKEKIQKTFLMFFENHPPERSVKKKLKYFAYKKL